MKNHPFEPGECNLVMVSFSPCHLLNVLFIQVHHYGKLRIVSKRRIQQNLNNKDVIENWGCSFDGKKAHSFLDRFNRTNYISMWLLFILDMRSYVVCVYLDALTSPSQIDFVSSSEKFLPLSLSINLCMLYILLYFSLPKHLTCEIITSYDNSTRSDCTCFRSQYGFEISSL